MRSFSTGWALAISAGAAVGLSSVASAITLDTVIKTNDPVPGLSGGEVWLGAGAFSLSGIDNSGNVAFLGTLQGTNASPGPGSPPVTGSNAKGLWYGATGSLSLFARDGTAGPMLPGLGSGYKINNLAGTGTGFVFSGPAITGNGTLFQSTQLGGASATSTNNSAMWAGPSNSMQLVAQRSTTSVLPNVTINSDLSLLAALNKVNGSGQVLVKATTLVGTGVVSGTWTDVTNLTTDSGYFVAGPSGITKVAQEGDAAPGTNAHFGEALSGFVGSINAHGDAVFVGGLRSGYTGDETITSNVNSVGAWSNAGGTLKLVARENDLVPGLSGVKYNQLGNFYNSTPQDFNYNANGARLIYASKFLAGTGGVVANVNDEAYMTWTPAAGASVLYRDGDAAPSAFGDAAATIKSLNATNAQFRLNNNDRIAFAAQMTGGSTTTSTDEALFFAAIGGTPTLIAREGSPAGLTGATFGQNLVGGSALLLNNLDHAAFINTLSDGSKAIFVWDATNGLTLVARTGTIANGGSTIAGLGTLTNLAFGNSGTGDSGSTNFSDTDWLTFTASDGTNTAIVRTQVPAPGALALLGLAGVVTGRRRRR
jgi:hypothetical protein